MHFECKFRIADSAPIASTPYDRREFEMVLNVREFGRRRAGRIYGFEKCVDSVAQRTRRTGCHHYQLGAPDDGSLRYQNLPTSVAAERSRQRHKSRSSTSSARRRVVWAKVKD